MTKGNDLSPLDMQAISWRAALVSSEAIVLQVCINGSPMPCYLLEEEDGVWVEVVDMAGTKGNIVGRLTDATMALLAKRFLRYEDTPRVMTFKDAMESESSN